MVRGIRGATTVENNDAVEIREATKELLSAILTENDLKTEDIASALFTVTPDLNASFPAASAREIGWALVPLICSTEIPVPGGLSNCIRIMIHANTDRAQADIRHIFLRRATVLRPDLVKGSE